MKITHKISNFKNQKEIEQNKYNFLLTNNIGGYVSLSEKNTSRFQGAHFYDEEMFKVIENFILEDAPVVDAVENNLYSFVRKRKRIKEEFFMVPGKNVLAYKTNFKGWIDLVFDCHKMYDYDLGENLYLLEKKDDKIILTFKRQKFQGSYKFYVVIKGDDLKFEPADHWYETAYTYDNKRGSKPDKRFVYKALKLKAKNMVISFDFFQEDAEEEADYCLKNLKKIEAKAKKKVEKKFKKIHKKNKNVNMAYNCAVNSLDKSIVNGNLIAGYYWFFQDWSRDELISLKSFILTEDLAQVKKTLLKYFEIMTDKGRLLNFYGRGNKENADGIGWLFKRFEDFIEYLKQKKKLGMYIDEDDFNKIMTKLETDIFDMLKHYSKEGFIFNNPQETWMDTSKTPREGIRIEIQALTLAMYRLMRFACAKVCDPTKVKMINQLEKKLVTNVKEKFFKQGCLYDGIDDPTIRPNIFLAYYIYPELLKKDEWITCFDNALESLWNEWGGLSTIDKKDPKYQPYYTGEDNISYHNGDSWFFVNNIAAICMLDLDEKHFKEYIKKIVKSSSDEILWQGILGSHAEVSSSSELRSEGGLCQSWSNATFIELTHKYSQYTF